MAETPLQAIYEVVFAELNAITDSSVWQSVHTDYIPAQVSLDNEGDKPVCLITYIGGGETQQLRRETASMTIEVKCVGISIEETMQGSQEIKAALRNKGTNDSGDYATAHDDWQVLTTTQGNFVHSVDMYSGALPMLYTGHRFTIYLEETGS